MKIAYIIGSNSRNSGGLYNSVRNLAETVGENESYTTKIFGYNDERSKEDKYIYQKETLVDYNIIGSSKLAFTLDLKKKIKEFKPNVIHPQFLWLYPSYVSSKYSLKNKIPVVISPRGMIDKWAISKSGWKKSIIKLLYEDRHLRNAVVLHALCVSEAKMMRNYGLKNPICIIPNGVHLGKINYNQFENNNIILPKWKLNTNLNQRKVLLFLSRIHPKKNLENLIQAFHLVKSKERKNWVLAIAGWGNQNYINSILKLVKDCNLENDVFLIGPQLGEEKKNTFKCADAFILPSFSEGLPMAVLEAWSYGIPSLITPECNLPEAFHTDAAIKIHTDSESILEGLEKLFLLSEKEAAKISNNALNLLKEKFSWKMITQKMQDTYEAIYSNSLKDLPFLYD